MAAFAIAAASASYVCADAFGADRPVKDLPGANLGAYLEDGRVILKWDPKAAEGLGNGWEGWEVVRSSLGRTPAWPQDGNLMHEARREGFSSWADESPEFFGGRYRICAVAREAAYCSRDVAVRYGPGEPYAPDYGLPLIELPSLALTGSISERGVRLEWNTGAIAKIEGRWKYWKVIGSKRNEVPTYQKDGFLEKNLSRSGFHAFAPRLTTMEPVHYRVCALTDRAVYCSAPFVPKAVPGFEIDPISLLYGGALPPWPAHYPTIPLGKQAQDDLYDLGNKILSRLDHDFPEDEERRIAWMTWARARLKTLPGSSPEVVRQLDVFMEYNLKKYQSSLDVKTKDGNNYVNRPSY